MAVDDLGNEADSVQIDFSFAPGEAQFLALKARRKISRWTSRERVVFPEPERPVNQRVKLMGEEDSSERKRSVRGRAGVPPQY